MVIRQLAGEARKKDPRQISQIQDGSFGRKPPAVEAEEGQTLVFFWGGGCKRSATASESPTVTLYCSSAQVFFDLNALSFLVPAPITISKYISSSIRRNKLHIVIGYSKMQNRIILFVFHAQEV